MEELKAVILAAGKGTRLHTEGCDLPKVMRLALGRPLISYVLDGVDFVSPENVVIVVGYMREKVTEAFPQYKFAVQDQQLGTGHAVMSAAPLLEGYDGAVLICCGDMPLIKKSTYMALAETHFSEKNACTVLSGTTGDKLPYGRIVRDGDGNFLKMVEEKDCTPEEREIKELNAGVYIFDAKKLIPALSKLRSDNAQGEYYLTDVPAILRGQGDRVGICRRELGSEIIGVNTAEQLKQVEELLK